MAGENRETQLIQRLVTLTTWSRLQKHAKCEFVLTQGMEEPIDRQYDDEISMIMLWGMMGSLTLKTHFSLENAIRLAATGLGQNAADISRDMARDFMKEASNMQAGYLRGFFESNRVLLGMSLPFLADGSDELVFRKIRDPRAALTVWQMTCGDIGLVFTAEICLLDPRTVHGVRDAIEKEILACEKPQNPDDDGEIQFL